jgi:hypothetical protein
MPVEGSPSVSRQRRYTDSLAADLFAERFARDGGVSLLMEVQAASHTQRWKQRMTTAEGRGKKRLSTLRVANSSKETTAWLMWCMRLVVFEAARKHPELKRLTC